jgi:RNA polymerase sigma-70 factor (sigma-E family)
MDERLQRPRWTPYAGPGILRHDGTHRRESPYQHLEATILPVEGGPVASTEDEVASFVAARRRGLVRFGFMLSGDLAAGEDLVQEALVRCLPSWGRLDPQGVEAYVRKVMARLAWGARRQPFAKHLTLDQANPASPDTTETSAELTDLRRALASLPPKQRVVLVLRYWQDLDVAEIAAMLGCRQGTVKSRASRAYAHLRQELGWSDVEIEAHPPAVRRGVR